MYGENKMSKSHGVLPNPKNLLPEVLTAEGHKDSWLPPSLNSNSVGQSTGQRGIGEPAGKNGENFVQK